VLPGVAAPQPGARPDVRVFDATHKFVCPAFVDAHFHLIALANKSCRVDLSGATSARDVVLRLTAGTAAYVGVDFDESAWEDGTLPTRSDLNAVSATQPVYARRVCCHVGVVNDALINILAARVSARFVDRESGRITEDAVFEANRLTRPEHSAVATAMDGAIAHLHSLGITAIHDIVDPDTIDVYTAGLRASRRPLRIDAYVHCRASEFEPARARFDAIGGDTRAVGIKIFSDGSLGARTAALHEPYADADTTGELLVERASLREELTACVRQGIACAVHAIGDRALATVLDAMGDAAAPGARFRIEHAEVVGDGELERIQRLGVPLMMQPNFVRNWGGEGGMYERPLGSRALAPQQSVRDPAARRRHRGLQLRWHAARSAVRTQRCDTPRGRRPVHRRCRCVPALHDGRRRDVERFGKHRGHRSRCARRPRRIVGKPAHRRSRSPSRRSHVCRRRRGLSIPRRRSPTPLETWFVTCCKNRDWTHARAPACVLDTPPLHPVV
jgi:predicted amidohydrolase YtcJ